jgi:hypothetical protein
MGGGGESGFGLGDHGLKRIYGFTDFEFCWGKWGEGQG